MWNIFNQAMLFLAKYFHYFSSKTLITFVWVLLGVSTLDSLAKQSFYTASSSKFYWESESKSEQHKAFAFVENSVEQEETEDEENDFVVFDFQIPLFSFEIEELSSIPTIYFSSPFIDSSQKRYLLFRQLKLDC